MSPGRSGPCSFMPSVSSKNLNAGRPKNSTTRSRFDWGSLNMAFESTTRIWSSLLKNDRYKRSCLSKAVRPKKLRWCVVGGNQHCSSPINLPPIDNAFSSPSAIDKTSSCHRNSVGAFALSWGICKHSGGRRTVLCTSLRRWQSKQASISKLKRFSQVSKVNVGIWCSFLLLPVPSPPPPAPLSISSRDAAAYSVPSSALLNRDKALNLFSFFRLRSFPRLKLNKLQASSNGGRTRKIILTSGMKCRRR